jgi:PIN domain nuclease of toxin-antitoxin system
MLVAQAFGEGLPIVTHDKRFSDYDVSLMPT